MLHCTCTHSTTDGYCCTVRELAVLRESVDQALNVLDAEARAPIVLDDGGSSREVVRSAVSTLRAARRTGFRKQATIRA